MGRKIRIRCFVPNFRCKRCQGTLIWLYTDFCEFSTFSVLRFAQPINYNDSPVRKLYAGNRSLQMTFEMLK